MDTPVYKLNTVSEAKPVGTGGVFEPGSLLRRTYRIVERLAMGGMGEVYEAAHERLAGRFAVKVLHRDLVRNREAFTRFAREGLVMSGLQHPHIAQVVDFDVSEDGTPYLVMEFLAGETLQNLLDRGGPLPPDRVSTIVRQIASALHAAHAQGVVHRDLKPENVMLLPQEAHAAFVKVLDFGISKVDWSVQATGESTRMGTPAYMSPEQAQGRMDLVDHRSDQFSLAALTYALLAGTHPFRGTHDVAVIYQVVHEDPPPLPRSLGAMATVVKRGLAKIPDERYPDVLAFSRALDAALASLDPLRTTDTFRKDSVLRSVADENGKEWPLAEKPRSGAREPADLFSMRRSVIGESSPPAVPPGSWPRLTTADHEAALCFDRGLALVADKQYAEGLRQWERALELDPENRTYQSNLKRLRARIARESTEGGDRS